jgi:hypothetical protein
MERRVAENWGRVVALTFEGDAVAGRAPTSRTDPSGLHRAEAFWNSRRHGLATVGLWSVPAFLPGSASVDTSVLRSGAHTRDGIPLWVLGEKR